MVERRAALWGLFAVSLLWGCNYVISAYLLRGFSPIFLSFTRISMTSVFLFFVGLKIGGLRWPTKREWILLGGAGVFGTLFNQTFYFTGLHQSTAANAALIFGMSPVATTVLERIFLKERLTASKGIGALLGLCGIIIIVGAGGGGIGVSRGDFYLLLAMLGLSISLLFIRSLTNSMSSYAVTIFATILGSVLMAPAAAGEALLSHVIVSHAVYMWLLMGAAGIIAQGLAGFWWNKGVSVVGAGTASMFMNIPPFIALVVGHVVLGDPIRISQVAGGVLVLLGVFVGNQGSVSLNGGSKVSERAVEHAQ